MTFYSKLAVLTNGGSTQTDRPPRRRLVKKSIIRAQQAGKAHANEQPDTPSYQQYSTSPTLPFAAQPGTTSATARQLAISAGSNTAHAFTSQQRAIPSRVPVYRSAGRLSHSGVRSKTVVPPQPRHSLSVLPEPTIELSTCSSSNRGKFDIKPCQIALPYYTGCSNAAMPIQRCSSDPNSLTGQHNRRQPSIRLVPSGTDMDGELNYQQDDDTSQFTASFAKLGTYDNCRSVSPGALSQPSSDSPHSQSIETSANAMHKNMLSSGRNSPSLTTMTFFSELDDSITTGYRPSNSSERRLERRRSHIDDAVAADAEGGTPYRRAVPEELLAQIVESSMRPRSTRTGVAHGVVAGPRPQKPSQKDLTALPACNSNKPSPPIRIEVPHLPRPLPSVMRHVLVNPPLYNPLERPGYQWISPHRQTSRPTDVWAPGKRWICCACDSLTIVEQQVCSRLCCQHARCQRQCRVARFV